MKRLEKTLANGMRMILIHRPGWNQSLFLAGFECGGMDIGEVQNGKKTVNPTGCAHFLEHQMFRLEGSDVSGRFAGMQAAANAFTSQEETAYYFHTTADPIPPLGLLLDFVQTLDITPESIENEKGIILSEYYGYEQDPDSRLFSELFQSLYHNHPLRTDILGTPQDIQAMTCENLTDFYTRHYDPSRLILVGVTGKELEPIAAFIEQHEKKFPQKTDMRTERSWEAEPEGVRRPYHELEMEVASPYVGIGIKLKPEGNRWDNLKKDMALNLWLEGTFGPSNPQYQQWLDARIFSRDFGAEADLTPDHAYILFYAQTDRPDAFRQMVLEQMQKKDPLSQETFETLRMPQLARNLRMKDHFETLALEELRAAIQGLSLDEINAIPQFLKPEDVNKIRESVTLQNVAEVRILPRKMPGQE